ncbi:hypothetical protein VNO78_25124 [Psophocarpus tetragonolobus]|uniref:Uncharacterized protein n=1 Tax=Psophocarpus tetragonolobus TaxID=3891 RepID=A0AAN9S5D1_PSOTE
MRFCASRKHKDGRGGFLPAIFFLDFVYHGVLLQLFVNTFIVHVLCFVATFARFLCWLAQEDPSRGYFFAIFL